MKEPGAAKYKQIKEEIRGKIERGVLKTGDRIPSEARLCKQYGVSRITVSRAIHDLVEAGYLNRIQGKGTFVKETVIQEGILRLTGFSERMGEKNLPLRTELIKRGVEVIPVRMAEFFQLNEGANVILLKRLRIVDGRPFCLSISYLMPEIFYWVLAEDLEKESLYDLLENKYKTPLGEATQMVQIDYLPAEDAERFELSEQDPFLKLSLFAVLKDGRAAQFEETYYVGDRYVYEMHLNRDV